MTSTSHELIRTARRGPTRVRRCAERSRRSNRAHHARRGNVWAALSLVVLTPMIAEITLGTTPLSMAWLMLLYLPIYGAGVLLIRELVRRTSGGWASVLLLGVAYGLVVEGIVLQSLTSSALDGAAGWAPRVLGVNAAYAELTLAYHAVFSVTIPIALVELLFARHGRAPYLHHAGMIRTGVLALLGVALVRIIVSPTTDPAHLAPPAVLLTFAALAGVLGILALLVLPNLNLSRPSSTCQRSTCQSSRTSRLAGITGVSVTPRPAVAAASCGVTTLVFLSLLFQIGATRRAVIIDQNWVLAAMSAAAILVLVNGLLVRQWSTAPGWTARHRLATLTGPLIAHTVFGTAAVAHTFIDIVALTLLAIIMVTALVALDHHLQVRCSLADLQIPSTHFAARYTALGGPSQPRPLQSGHAGSTGRPVMAPKKDEH